MGSRSLGELLLHPASRISSAQNFRRAVPSWSTYRMVSTSNTPNPSNPSQPQPENSSPAPSQPASNAPSQRPTPAGAAQTSQAIDSLLGDIPSFNSRGRKSYGSPRSSGMSAASMGAKVFGEGWAGSQQTLRFKRAGLDVDSMAGILPSIEQKPTAAIPPEKQVYPRLNPTYGRTIDLDESRGRDLVRGIGMLTTLMARNKVRADFKKQMFHERGGLRRKRLKSERWRARFKKGFHEVTSRVNELTRKGW